MVWVILAAVANTPQKCILENTMISYTITDVTKASGYTQSWGSPSPHSHSVPGLSIAPPSSTFDFEVVSIPADWKGKWGRGPPCGRHKASRKLVTSLLLTFHRPGLRRSLLQMGLRHADPSGQP